MTRESKFISFLWNDYSFKLNDSNSNDINSYQTSKFCNSLIFSDEKGNDEIEKTDAQNAHGA